MEYNREYTQYQLERSWLRKVIRRSYMNHTAAFVRGRAIDFGCGIGDLLKMLPPGSLGLEINKATVDYCRGIGLNVSIYDLAHDDYQFNDLKPGFYNTFIVSHVLEHLDNADNVFRQMASSCLRLGIQRIILVVPGQKGFAYDKTHRTFIDKGYLHRNNLQNVLGYSISITKHYPFNASWAGKYFTHNELLVVYDKNERPAHES
jgi:SAM-dependent methyltransferase